MQIVSSLILSVTLTILATPWQTTLAYELTKEEQAAIDQTQPKPLHFKALGDREPLTIPKVDRDKVICFCLYTSDASVLKLSAQLYPLQEGESRDVTLEINRDEGWEKVVTQQVDTDHWMTTFRIEDWDDSKAGNYRVTHPGGASYEGILRADPKNQEEIVVAAFTGNSNSDRGPRADIVRNVKAQDPDLLFFSGDQSYDHSRHLAAWLLFGRQFGEIIRDRPTVTIPDDHDVGQPNLWGAGGKQSFVQGGDDGGYIKPAKYVNMVQRAQCAHLPDPVDPTPITQDITVYYTKLNLGGVDFAIIEDRKWKTGPNGIVPKQGPRADHITDPHYDPASLDQPEAVLLGDRQLKFLEAWAEDWNAVPGEANPQLKCVLSQTIFAGGAHLHGLNGRRLVADMDSNGWPQTGRNRALAAMRKAFAFHIAGDQHLATVIHHGVNEWEDAGWSFCVPSIVNFYGRWWWPLEEATPGTPQSLTPQATGLRFTGRYHDGFANKLTMAAYANPTLETQNAAGYGLVRFNKKTRQITMECWPRGVDVTQAGAEQLPGWPITITQQDNYDRQAQGYLPRLQFSEESSPVVQVVKEGQADQADEVVYTLRVNEKEMDLPVYAAKSTYTIRITDGEETQEVTRVTAWKEPASRVVKASELTANPESIQKREPTPRK